MKPACKMFNAVLLAAGTLAMSSTAALSQPLDSAPSPQPTAPAPAPDHLAGLVVSIQRAADPSTAIDAYARASAQVGEDERGALEEAFLRRMVDFGLPEMADRQAQDLMKRAPVDGLAVAVGAYMTAKRGDPGKSLTQIPAAVRLAPDEPFVQRTAGQLLAWYDTKADQTKIQDGVKEVTETLRAQLKDRPKFAEAYRSAADAYHRETLAQGTQPAEPERPMETARAGPDDAAPDEGPTGYAPPSTESTYTYEGYSGAIVYQPVYEPVYTNPLVAAPCPGYSYWEPSVPYYDSYWWPTFSFGFFVSDFHHHGDHHDDHHDHHDFDHDGGHHDFDHGDSHGHNSSRSEFASNGGFDRGQNFQRQNGLLRSDRDGRTERNGRDGRDGRESVVTARPSRGDLVSRRDGTTAHESLPAVRDRLQSPAPLRTTPPVQRAPVTRAPVARPAAPVARPAPAGGGRSVAAPARGGDGPRGGTVSSAPRGGGGNARASGGGGGGARGGGGGRR